MGLCMKFNFFHLMPWTHYEAFRRVVVGSDGFDGGARLLYDDYITPDSRRDLRLRLVRNGITTAPSA